MSISDYEMAKQHKREDWDDLREAFLDDPVQATNHLCLGFNLNQRKQARNHAGKKSVPTWT